MPVTVLCEDLVPAVQRDSLFFRNLADLDLCGCAHRHSGLGPAKNNESLGQKKEEAAPFEGAWGRSKPSEEG